MRTTVGPLPSAVYWRRRAVVLGAVLLGVLVLFFSCSGGDDDKNGASTPASNPASPDTAASPTEEPSFSDVPDGAANPSRPAPEDLESAGTATGGETPDGTTTTGTTTGGGSDVNSAAGTTCTDAEISLTPIPAGTSTAKGATLQIRLKISNVSTRTCSRDVGADLQELYIESGAQKIWSSDTCSDSTGSDVREFPAGTEREYMVTWNGRQDSACSAGLATGPTPAAGQYQIRARLGGKVSDPVTLTVTG